MMPLVSSSSKEPMSKASAAFTSPLGGIKGGEYCGRRGRGEERRSSERVGRRRRSRLTESDAAEPKCLLERLITDKQQQQQHQQKKHTQKKPKVLRFSFLFYLLGSFLQSEYIYNTTAGKQLSALVPGGGWWWWGGTTVVQSIGVKHKGYPRCSAPSQTLLNNGVEM